MKKLILLICCLSFQALAETCPSMTDLESKQNVITTLIQKYQGKHFSRHKTSIRLVFKSNESCQKMEATTARYPTESIITISQGLFQLSHGGVAFAICHEIGHLLGNMPDENMKKKNRLSLESEADFWGGKCLQQFLRETTSTAFNHDEVPECHGDLSCEQTVTAAKNVLEKIWKDKFDYRKALNQEYKGIIQFYSNGHCRLLTVLNGATNGDRPKCWYNPQDLPSPAPTPAHSPTCSYSGHEQCRPGLI